MSLILNIETSTSVCSVALSEGEGVVFEKASFEGPSHAALLGVYMEEALEVAKSKGMKLDAVDIVFFMFQCHNETFPAYCGYFKALRETVRIYHP